MILGSTYGQQQMGEGRYLQTSSVNLTPFVEIPVMPPHYKVDNSTFNARGLPRQPPPAETIKSYLPQKEDPHLHSQSHVRASITSTLSQPVSAAVTTSSPQPFTAPWLTDVARMTPLSFSSTAGSSLAEYYHHFQNIPHNTHPYSSQYASPMPYVSDLSHPSIHPTPAPQSISADSRIRSDIPEIPTNMHSFTPLPSSHCSSVTYRGYPLDLRGQSTNTLHKEKLPLRAPHQKTLPVNLNLSPKDHVGEPNTKKRSFYLPPPSSPLPHTMNSPTTIRSYPSTSRRTNIPQSSLSDTAQVSNPQSSHSQSSNTPFHSHFRRGSLVTLGKKILRVEELRTSDFVEAANESDDLLLDPSAVGAITSNVEKDTSVITFRFPSTNNEIPVEASNDHPFFVYHKGWSSCNPEKTLLKYDLKVKQLNLGDVCVSLRKNASSSTSRSEVQSGSKEMPPPKTPPKTFSSFSTLSTVPSTSSSYLSSSSSSNVSLSSSTPFSTTTTTTSVTNVIQLPSLSHPSVTEHVTLAIPSPSSVRISHANVSTIQTKSIPESLSHSTQYAKDAPFSPGEKTTRNQNKKPASSVKLQRSKSKASDVQKFVKDSQSKTKSGRKRRWSDPGR